MRTTRGCILLASFLCAALALAQSPIDQLIADLKNTDIVTRSTAAKNLWDISEHDPGAVKAVIPALSQAILDENLNVRFMVIVTLKNIGPDAKVAVPSLIKALDTFPGRNPPLQGPPRYYADARSIAADALGAIGPDAKDAIPALQIALKDPSKMVRESAAAALKQIRRK